MLASQLTRRAAVSLVTRRSIVTCSRAVSAIKVHTDDVPTVSDVSYVCRGDFLPATVMRTCTMHPSRRCGQSVCDFRADWRCWRVLSAVLCGGVSCCCCCSVNVTFVNYQGSRKTFQARVGDSLLEVAQKNDYEFLDGACGWCACVGGWVVCCMSLSRSLSLSLAFSRPWALLCVCVCVLFDRWVDGVVSWHDLMWCVCVCVCVCVRASF